jgi:hypothetical protein
MRFYGNINTGIPSEIGLALQWWANDISLRLGIGSIVFSYRYLLER